MESDRVVDAIAEEANVLAERALSEDDARFLLGSDAREDRRLRQGVAKRVLVHRRELGAGQDAAGLEPELPAELGGDLAVVAGDDLDRDTKAREARERLTRLCLDRIGE